MVELADLEAGTVRCENSSLSNYSKIEKSRTESSLNLIVR